MRWCTSVTPSPQRVADVNMRHRQALADNQSSGSPQHRLVLNSYRIVLKIAAPTVGSVGNKCLVSPGSAIAFNLSEAEDERRNDNTTEYGRSRLGENINSRTSVVVCAFTESTAVNGRSHERYCAGSYLERIRNQVTTTTIGW